MTDWVPAGGEEEKEEKGAKPREIREAGASAKGTRVSEEAQDRGT